MTPEETRKAAEVMLGYADEKKVQWREKTQTSWHDECCPSWNWARCIFRIKPRPKEIWVNEYDDGEQVFHNRVAAIRCSASATRTVHYVEVEE